MGLMDMVNPPRTPGQHSRSKTTKPKPATVQEEPVTQQQQQAPAVDDLVLDDWYTAHLDAAAKRDHAGQQAAAFEDEGRRYRKEAADALNEITHLRDLLAAEEKKAEQATLMAQGAENRAQEWRNFETQQKGRASGHKQRIEAEVAKGAEHPQVRQPKAQGPLDGPSAVRLGPPPTQEFPRVDPQAANFQGGS